MTRRPSCSVAQEGRAKRRAWLPADRRPKLGYPLVNRGWPAFLRANVVFPRTVGAPFVSWPAVRARTRIPDTRVFPDSVVAIAGRGVVVAERIAERPVHPRTASGAARRRPRLLDWRTRVGLTTASDMALR